MWYVYFLKSLKKTNYTYTGSTNDLKRRLEEHNSDNSKLATANYRPLDYIAYIGVKDKIIALNLEKYFKTCSGRAFLKKRFI